jgi:ligand-binding sensor domain-containing protein
MLYFKPSIIFFSYLLTFLLSLNNLWASVGKYPIQNFSPTDYKAGIQNIDFAQNRDMSLFVANNLGVLDYDGNDWEVHAPTSGKKVRSLAFDKKTNRLYVGSQGAFGFFENDWNYVSLAEQLPTSSQGFDDVWDVFISYSNVYFCTFQGIYVYDGQTVQLIEQEGGFNRSFQVNDRLFTQNQAGELFEIKDQQLVATYPRNHTQQVITGMIPYEAGYLLFYNSGNIEFATPFGVRKVFDKLVNTLAGKYINHVFQLSDTRLAICTQTAGLFLYDLQNQNLENISIQDGLLTNACLRVFQDYSGMLWVGLQNGMALIDIHSPMRFINQEIDLQGSGYEAYETEEGTYYTTSNGIYFLAENATNSVIVPGTEGPSYGLQKISEKLYVGHHTGLFLLKNGSAKRIARTEGLWKISRLRSNPAYAIGGTYYGLFLFGFNDEQELRAIGSIDGFNESSRFFEEDPKGKIWVGQFYKGLYQLTLSDDLTTASVKKIAASKDLPIDEQITLSQIDNKLYIATRAGIYQINETSGEMTAAPLFANLGEQPIYLLAQDHQKNIHVVADNIVGFYKQISANNYVFIPSSLSKQRYSLNNDLLQLSINTNGGVLFSANKGFINYQPELENRVAVETPLIVSKVFSLFEDNVLYAHHSFIPKPENIGKLEIAKKSKVLQFEVKSFQFNEVNDQLFRYFLKGFDDDYGIWTNANIKEYTNLEAGDYEFLVQTRNYLGETVSSQPFPLTIKTPFFLSPTIKLLYTGLGVLLLYLILSGQQRRYKRKTQQVEIAKQEELDEIEKQKELELLQLEEDKTKSELRHTNNLLAASTMNLVVKNEFIETIKEKLVEVNRVGKSGKTNQVLEQLIRDIDTTLRLQEDWEQFEYHFDQVHGDFLSRLRDEFHELTPNEQKLCAFLRLNLNTKDIANLMGVTTRGVEVARYRLRKKLNLGKGENLSKFVLEY